MSTKLQTRLQDPDVSRPRRPASSCTDSRFDHVGGDKLTSEASKAKAKAKKTETETETENHEHGISSPMEHLLQSLIVIKVGFQHMLVHKQARLTAHRSSLISRTPQNCPSNLEASSP
jgi:hypothetical protein